MATFVLVHGGWHGGWCWQKVIPFLEAAGHQVYAPTLTGLAERAAELSPDVGLETHIKVFRQVFAEALAQKRVTVELRAAFSDQVIRASWLYEYLMFPVVLALMVLKPF